MRVLTLKTTLTAIIFGVMLICGCDEGMNITKPVMMEKPEGPTEPTETPETPAEESPKETQPVEEIETPEQPEDPITTIGEMKQPEEQPTETPKDEVIIPQPAAIEISCYRDADFTRPLVESVEVGTAIYIKVVFSEDVSVVIADTSEARPSIFSTIGSEKLQYRIKSRDTSNKDLKSGDAKPYRNTENSFICKYVVQTRDFRETFLTYTDDKLTSDPLRVIFFTYTSKDSPEYEPIVQQNPNDFIGVVSMANKGPFLMPVHNVTVTIMSGSRSGEQVITNQGGQYIFPNFQGDELHLRVEKEHFEPKEVIVHRSRKTILANGDTPNFIADYRNAPRSIQIGHHWPDEIRSILQQITVVHDLLYYEDPSLREDIRGSYAPSNGVISINSTVFDGKNRGVLHTFAHEITHAWQHAQISVDGSGSYADWKNTPSGKAFAEAREKDWKEKRKTRYYDTHPYYSSNLNQNAAEICALFWSIDQWWGGSFEARTLEFSAPNRFKWCKKWLTK